MYELTCRYDTRKSFYGKARVFEYDLTDLKLIELISYSTNVAYIKIYKNGEKKYVYNGYYSQTTTRHQKEFFKQNGLSDKEIKKLFKEGVYRKWDIIK